MRTREPRVAVVLTALPVEYQAVRAHLSDIREVVHDRGTVYEEGTFASDGTKWRVAIVETGVGNNAAAAATERMIETFHPSVVLFVGVAGGIKDVALGDLVAGTKVYGYHSGKAAETFRTRPDVGQSSFDLVQRARAEARRGTWLRRGVTLSGSPPRVIIGAIAAGEQVVASNRSDTYRFLRSQCEDAVAVEMEGRGFLEAVHASQPVSALVVRGISDLLERKQAADAKGWQEIAARHAAAFAFEVLSRLDRPDGLVADSSHAAPSESADPVDATIEPGLDGSRRVAGRISRAWAALDTQGGRWQFRSDKSGKVSQVVLADGEPARVPDDEGTSLAMSPDGSLLATMVGRTLRISTVGRSGTVHRWKDFDFDPDEEKPDVQVRAVARKGDSEVWCAVAYGDRTRFAGLSRSTQPVWQEAKKPKAAQYAAFHGSRLILVTIDRSGSAEPQGKCWHVPLRPEADAAEWAPIWRDPRTVTAIDAAKVGGRTYLCLLAGVADESEGKITDTDLIVWSADSADLLVERLASVYEHVSVVRHPEGDPETLCVLIAQKGDDRAWESRLLRRPGAST